jgi:16S rRNA (cytidine1402-2'-O)-methyltransferase
MPLFLVPTPIGNLEDITLRAIRILKEADVILAEDTRTSGHLMKHLGISRPMQAYHAHNEHQAIQKILNQLAEGQKLALVTDAGTPGISDPGFLIVREAIKAGYEVTSLPGPTAFVPALVNSGLPCDRFSYEGFLPLKKGRETRIKAIAADNRTIVLYESPHRLIKCLEQLATHCGADRQASVSREITKMFEETVRGSLAEIIKHFTMHPIKGEFVIVIAGKDE